MSAPENKALVRRLIEGAYNGKDLAIVADVIGSDYIGHFPGFERRGPEGIRTQFADDHAGWPDGLLVIDDQVAEDDKVATRWGWSGTHTGGPRPTGKYSTASGVIISRIADGQIMEEWWVWDNLGWLEQLGLAARMEST